MTTIEIARLSLQTMSYTCEGGIRSLVFTFDNGVSSPPQGTYQVAPTKHIQFNPNTEFKDFEFGLNKFNYLCMIKITDMQGSTLADIKGH